jgi:hypothetical protein
MRDVHSYSSLATLASCAEKFRLGYVEKLATRESAPQRAGTAFDAAINHLYVVGWDEAGASDALKRSWNGFRSPLGSKHDHLTEGFLLRRLSLYMREREEAPTLLERGEILTGFSGVTHVFEWPGDDGKILRLRGVPDFAVRDRETGRTYVVDLKTTNAWISDHWMMRFRIGHQLRIYAAMIQTMTGETVKGGLINAVYVGEKALDAPEAWKRRKSVPSALNLVDFTPEQVEEARAWALGLVEIERACEASGLWPRNEQACGDYGGCEFLDLCTAPSAMARRARMMSGFARKPEER